MIISVKLNPTKGHHRSFWAFVLHSKQMDR